LLGIIGPQSSSQAVPAGEVANNYATPMISPWSTNPNTTLDRPFVFRGCFLDPFQGPVAANFATDELGAKKAAVLYDIAADYPKGSGRIFQGGVRGRSTAPVPWWLSKALPPGIRIFPPR
jgi:branched-chain amino acid transport system substrate-binding protein